VIAKVGALTGEMVKAGVFLAGEGLQASSKGVRLNFSGGRRTLTKGPFTGSNELISGFCIVRVGSIDEAVEWATRFAEVVGDVEVDIRPVMEPWDLGFCPKPEGDSTVRFMMAHKADKNSEAGAHPAPEVMARMGRLIDDMVKAGVFVTAEGLRPSSEGVRVKFSKGQRTVTDGPFAESKELIAGYCILKADSKEEAFKWAPPFAEAVGDVEIDIRPLYKGPDCA
jgi:hypothetical protein